MGSVEGVTTGAGWGPPASNDSSNVTVYSQSSTILGWACCNMVATTHDVAGFFWELVHKGTVVPAETLNTMLGWHPLDACWAPPGMQYGTALMLDSVAFNTDGPFDPNAWGSYTGHGGDVYGFTSVNGIFAGLNASLSLNINTD